MANLDITERYDFQQWILKDLIQYNGYIQRAQSAYNQRLAMDFMGISDVNSRRNCRKTLEAF